MSDIEKLSEGSFFFKWLMEQKDGSLFSSQTISSVSEKENSEVLTHFTVPSQSRPQDFMFLSKDEATEHTETSKRSLMRGERYAQRNERFSKDKSFHPKIQKKNRNVLSNLAHHLLKFLANKEHIQHFTRRTVKLHQLSISVEECFQFFEWIENKLKSYVTEKCLKDFCLGNFGQKTIKSGNEANQDLAKLFRILCCRFYRLECIPSILLSSKLSQQSKSLHIKGIRDIEQILSQI